MNILLNNLNCIELSNLEMEQINGGVNADIIAASTAVALTGAAIVANTVIKQKLTIDVAKAVVGLSVAKVALGVPVVIAGSAMTAIGGLSICADAIASSSSNSSK